MALQRKAAPQPVLDELFETLESIRDLEESQDGGVLRDVDLKKLRAEGIDAHEIYVIDPSNASAGHGVSAAAKPSGWRFLIDTCCSRLAAEVLYDSGRQPRFALLNEGRFVDDTVNLIQHYAADSRVLAGSYEVRVVSAPWLYVFGVWFKDLDKKGDFLVPIEPTHHLFNSEREYDIESFDGALQHAARLGHRVAKAQAMTVGV